MKRFVFATLVFATPTFAQPSSLQATIDAGTADTTEWKDIAADLCRVGYKQPYRQH